MKNQGVNFSNKIDFNGAKSQKLIHYYADGVKDGYFGMAGSDKHDKRVAIIITSSAAEDMINQTKKGFHYDVAPRPSKYTLQQGTDIYMFKQATTIQRAAAFKYIKFLVSQKS